MHSTIQLGDLNLLITVPATVPAISKRRSDNKIMHVFFEISLLLVISNHLCLQDYTLQNGQQNLKKAHNLSRV